MHCICSSPQNVQHGLDQRWNLDVRAQARWFPLGMLTEVHLDGTGAGDIGLHKLSHTPAALV